MLSLLLIMTLNNYIVNLLRTLANQIL